MKCRHALLALKGINTQLRPATEIYECKGCGHIVKISISADDPAVQGVLAREEVSVLDLGRCETCNSTTPCERCK